MTPPLIPHIIVIALAAPADYESVAGDLHEEYIQRAGGTGRAEANRWYWSQAIRSIPSLLSYTRSDRSLWKSVRTAVVVIVNVVAMMICYERVREAIFSVHPCSEADTLCTWPYFLSGWLVAAIFGAILSAIVRSHSIRITLVASVGLIASIALPTAFGFSSPLSLLAWTLLLSVIPAMSAGGAIFQMVRRR